MPVATFTKNMFHWAHFKLYCAIIPSEKEIIIGPEVLGHQKITLND